MGVAYYNRLVSRSWRITAIFDTAGATNKAFLADPQAVILITTQALMAEGEQSGRLKGGVTYRLGDTVAGFAALLTGPAGRAALADEGLRPAER